MIVNASFFFLILSAVIETSCHLLMGKLSNTLLMLFKNYKKIVDKLF